MKSSGETYRFLALFLSSSGWPTFPVPDQQHQAGASMVSRRPCRLSPRQAIRTYSARRRTRGTAPHRQCPRAGRSGQAAPICRGRQWPCPGWGRAPRSRCAALVCRPPAGRPRSRESSDGRGRGPDIGSARRRRLSRHNKEGAQDRDERPSRMMCSRSCHHHFPREAGLPRGRSWRARRNWSPLSLQGHRPLSRWWRHGWWCRHCWPRYRARRAHHAPPWAARRHSRCHANPRESAHWRRRRPDRDRRRPPSHLLPAGARQWPARCRLPRRLQAPFCFQAACRAPLPTLLVIRPRRHPATEPSGDLALSRGPTGRADNSSGFSLVRPVEAWQPFPYLAHLFGKPEGLETASCLGHTARMDPYGRITCGGRFETWIPPHQLCLEGRRCPAQILCRYPEDGWYRTTEFPAHRRDRQDRLWRAYQVRHRRQHADAPRRAGFRCRRQKRQAHQSCGKRPYRLSHRRHRGFQGASQRQWNRICRLRHGLCRRVAPDFLLRPRREHHRGAPAGGVSRSLIRLVSLCRQPCRSAWPYSHRTAAAWIRRAPAPFSRHCPRPRRRCRRWQPDRQAALASRNRRHRHRSYVAFLMSRSSEAQNRRRHPKRTSGS